MIAIKKIVITGGPCSGKTSALKVIKDYFGNLGYMVFIINESATELINNGIAPFENNQISRYFFQKMIFKYQYMKELLYEEFIEQIDSEKPKLILYDRGGMDYKSFLSDEEALQIMSAENMNEASILAKYDLVIYLKSVANGLSDEYTLENNKARTENIEEAKLLDVRTLEVWQHHPNLKRVGIYDTFEEKAKEIINLIENELSIGHFFLKKKCKSCNCGR